MLKEQDSQAPLPAPPRQASSLLAFFLTLFLPAVGGTYATNKLRTGILFFLLSFIPYVALWLYAFLGYLPFIPLFVILGLGTHFALAIWAARLAKEERNASNTIVNILLMLMIVFVLRSGSAPLRPVKVYKMSGESLAPSLRKHDRVLVNTFAYGLWNSLAKKKISFGEGPERGDLIVFLNPMDTKKVFVKRVIGLPGDTIKMVKGTVSINGKTIVQKKIGGYSYKGGKASAKASPFHLYREDLFGKAYHIIRSAKQASPMPKTKQAWNGQKIPANKYFVLGDNRDNSLDSRVWGFISKETIVGKIEHRLLSIHKKKGIIWKESFKRLE